MEGSAEWGIHTTLSVPMRTWYGCLIGTYHLGDEVGAKSDDGYEGDDLHYSHDGERSAESPHVCFGHYVVGGKSVYGLGWYCKFWKIGREVLRATS